MGVRKNQVWTTTRYISRMSVKREATVKRIIDIPAVKRVVIRTEIGRNHHVAWMGKPVTATMRMSGNSERVKLTSPPPTADATKTERGTNIRLAISLEACVCDAADEVVCEKNVQKIDPAMK